MGIVQWLRFRVAVMLNTVKYYKISMTLSVIIPRQNSLHHTPPGPFPVV